jgi:hypothetical protein
MCTVPLSPGVNPIAVKYIILLMLLYLCVLLTKYYLGDQNNKNKTGCARGTYGKREVQKGFRWGDLKEGDNLEDLDIDGRIVLQWIFKKWEG